MNKKVVSVKCNANLGVFKKGQVVRVELNERGTPKEKFWRNRFRDAEHDKCCEIVGKENKAKEAKKSGQDKKSEQSE